MALRNGKGTCTISTYRTLDISKPYIHHAMHVNKRTIIKNHYLLWEIVLSFAFVQSTFYFNLDSISPAWLLPSWRDQMIQIKFVRKVCTPSAQLTSPHQHSSSMSFSNFWSFKTNYPLKEHIKKVVSRWLFRFSKWRKEQDLRVLSKIFTSHLPKQFKDINSF